MVNTKRILLGIVGLVLIIILAWVSWYIVIKPVMAVVPAWGAEITGAAVNAPSWLVSLVGDNAFTSWNALAVFLAVFFILLFAFADILTTFSSFSEGTAWAIAVGLSVIGIFTKVFDKIIVSIFGTVAVAGAIGIGLIILWAVGLAVAMNFLVGWSGIKAMKAAGIDAAKIEEATSTMRKGFGVLKGAAVAGTGST